MLLKSFTKIGIQCLRTINSHTFAINKTQQVKHKLKMKIRLIFLIFTTFFSGFLVAQHNKSEMSYHRYEGFIGSNISITANIVQLYQKLTGNYQYRFIEEDNNMYFGKTIELEGEIDKNKNVKLREFGRDDFTFIGAKKQGLMDGTWHGPSDKTLPFKLNEYYPNGSMAFDVHYLHSEGKLIKTDPESPLAEIELVLIFPADKYINPAVTDSVKQWITNSFFGTGFEVKKPDSMLIHFEEEYLNTYVKQNKDWYSTGASFNWEKMISMSVVYNSNYMLCLEYLVYGYTGGSHGMTNVSYDIIYLDDGRLLTYADIFEGSIEGELSELLTKQLRKDYKIPDEIPLKEAGFFVDVVEPNHNIYVNGNGVGFLYNSYEIAAYSQGATHIFLEWDQLQGVVKKGTPVYQMSLRD